MKTLKFLLLIGLSFSNFFLSAQVYDDFSDGDFTSSPIWVGDTDQFMVNTQQQLQLNAPEAGRAYLATSTHFGDTDCEWRLSLKMSFAPSGSNYARYYLVADTSNLFATSHVGYFLQFGEAGSNDAIELFYQQGDSLVSVFRSNTSVSKSFFYNIKIIRNLENEWTLWVDTLRLGSYYLDTSGTHAAPLPPDGHLGPVCVFTSGNRTKFYFDDLYCGPPIIDTTSPSVSQWTFDIDAPNQLVISYSERVTDTSALDCTHYINRSGQQHPVLCEWEGEDEYAVRLYFAEALEERQEVAIGIQQVTDYNNNILIDTTLYLTYCIPRRHEILITEIMADPSPPVHLPECEYVELYNTLPFPISLKGWTLAMGNSRRTLPDSTLPPGGYSIVTGAANAPLFPSSAPVVAISSTSLTDDGQQVVLYDRQDRIIHRVQYSRSWHRNTLKRDGGWSLEMMDVGNPCGAADNWDSSNDGRGGTPGEANSIADPQRDESPPEWVKVTVPDAWHVRLFFSETLLTDSFPSPSLFGIEPPVAIGRAETELPSGQQITLTLGEELQQRVGYTLTLRGRLCDCVGNLTEEGVSLQFGLPEEATAGDIIINEVLTNPFADSDADYVELYNRSDKLLDVGALWLGAGNGDLPSQVVKAIPDGYQLFPSQYVAIAKSRALTLEQYTCLYPTRVVENAALPAYANDEGTVHLLDDSYHVIDRLHYTASMHHPLLTSTDGVALERIHPDAATQDETNWTSASENYGWGTPGYRNSQFSELAATDAEISVVPDVFSPDGDGNNDFAEIYCRFEEAGSCITIDLYNRAGQRVRRLAVNEPVGFEARYRWDGTSDDHRAANSDIYLVHIQLWNPNGKRKSYRRTVAVVRRE